MKKRKKKVIGWIIIIFCLSIFYLPIKKVSARLSLDQSLKITEGNNIYHYVENKGILKIENTNQAQDSFSAYKLLDLYYSDTALSYKYEFSEEFKNFQNQTAVNEYKEITVEKFLEMSKIPDPNQGNSENKIIGNKPNQDTKIDKLMNAYTSYVKEKKMKNPTIQTENQELTVGAYVIIPQKTNVVYGTMIAHIDIDQNQSAGQCTINTQYEIPSLTKTINEQSTISANENEKILNKIVVTLPTYENDIGKTYQIIDTISNGLEYTTEQNQTEGMILKEQNGKTIATGSKEQFPGNISINKKEDEKVKVAQITMDEENRKMIITIDASMITTNIIEITYWTKLSNIRGENQIQMAPTGNQSSAYMSYIKEDTNEVVNTQNSSCQIFTYGIKIMNTNQTDPLSGAEFTVYQDQELKIPVAKVEIGQDGTGILKYVKEGTYYIKQTKAPNGYQINKELTSIKVGGIRAISQTDEYYTVNIKNTVAISLPITGSKQTLIYTLVGLVFIIMAITATIMYKKNMEGINS